MALRIQANVADQDGRRRRSTARAGMIRPYIAWRNGNAHDSDLRDMVERATQGRPDNALRVTSPQHKQGLTTLRRFSGRFDRSPLGKVLWT